MDSLPAGDYHNQYQNSAFRGPRLTADDYKLGLNTVYKELYIAMSLAFSASFMLDQISAPFPLFNNHSVISWLTAFIIILMCTDIWQYVIHRILHIPFFFKHCHSQHHQYIKPYALSGLAGHWVEYIILPFPAICLGPWLVDLPMIPLIILFMILAAGNISGHNGHE